MLGILLTVLSAEASVLGSNPVIITAPRGITPRCKKVIKQNYVYWTHCERTDKCYTHLTLSLREKKSAQNQLKLTGEHGWGISKLNITLVC